MSKFLEVKDYDAGEGKEYVASNYPGPGLYWNSRLLQYFFCNGVSIFGTYTGAELPTVSQLPSAQSAAAAAPAAALDHIAMLAVVLHPEVASEYIKKGGAA